MLEASTGAFPIRCSPLNLEGKYLVDQSLLTSCIWLNTILRNPFIIVLKKFV